MNTDFDEIPISDAEMESDPFILVQQFILSGYQLVAGIAGLAIIILLFVKGFEWYWEGAFPLLSGLLAIPTLLCFPTGLLLAILKRTRGISGLLLLVSVLSFFAANWLQALGFAYIYAGKLFMIIGFLLAGIGVFAIAIIGALFHGEWYDALLLIASLVICWLVYVFASALVAGNAVRRIQSRRVLEYGNE